MLTSKRAWLRALAASVALVLLYLWFSPRLSSSPSKLPQFVKSESIDHASTDNESTQYYLPCFSLPGGNETLVVLRTGSTEIQDRLPIHTSTSFRCYPHHLIFSDYEEDFLGEHILDALDSVDPNIVAHHQDFELYRRLKQNGRAALAATELSGSNVNAEGATGHVDNPGWKLDKWKFLPMLNRTLFEYPDMKWYLFIEADTLIFWSSLQSYLAAKDHTKPHYAGDVHYIGDTGFAHGGAGFVVSQPALRTLMEYYAAHKAEIEAFTDGQWAGDLVLGKTFLNAGVPMTHIFPLMQGKDPGLLLYARENNDSVPVESEQQWCFPTASYHHLSPAVLEDLWLIEQQWLGNKVDESKILRHKDIFKLYVMPRMSTPRNDWDNLGEQEKSGITSFEDCRAACETEAECKQYSYDEAGRCKTRINPRLGLARKGVRSGWIEDRIIRFERDMVPCGSEGLDLVTPVLQTTA